MEGELLSDCATPYRWALFHNHTRIQLWGRVANTMTRKEGGKKSNEKIRLLGSYLQPILSLIAPLVLCEPAGLALSFATRLEDLLVHCFMYLDIYFANEKVLWRSLICPVDRYRRLRLVTAGEHEERCAPLVRSSKTARVSDLGMRGWSWDEASRC